MSVADSQVPAVLNVRILNGQVIFKCSSPTSIPSIFSELKYNIPKQMNTTMNFFMKTFNAEDAVFNYIHPENPNMPVIFKQVRIIKQQKAGEVKPQFTLHLIPMKDDPFVVNKDVTLQDFTEPTFSISLNPNHRLSRFSFGQMVALPMTMYNDNEIEAFLTPSGVAPKTDQIKKEALFKALGFPIVEAGDSFTFKNLVFMGRIKSVFNSGSKKEGVIVDFNQVMPVKALPEYKGVVNNLETALRHSYTISHGWQRDYVEQHLLGLVKVGLPEYVARGFIDEINALLFGSKPHSIYRLFLQIPDFSKEKNVHLPLKYKTKSGSFVEKSTIVSSRFLPMGAPLIMSSTNKVMQNVKVLSKTSDVNPFQCMKLCAKDGKCDMYTSVKNTCTLYDMPDEAANVIAGNLDRLLQSDPRSYNKAQKQYMEHQKISVGNYMSSSTGKPLDNVYDAWMDTKRNHKSDLKRAMKFVKKDKEIVVKINDTLRAAEKEKEVMTEEGFSNTETPQEIALSSALDSYKTAFKQAQETKDKLSLAQTQADMNLSQKIYYNLFTTALWILNLACLIAILYVIFVGFMGVEIPQAIASAPASVADVTGDGIIN